jgi:hypothetical protein
VVCFPNWPDGLVAGFSGTRLIFFGSKKLDDPCTKIGAPKQEVQNYGQKQE